MKYFGAGAAGILLGLLFPLAFIFLDLRQLGEGFQPAEIKFMVASQDIYLFSFLVFPVVFGAIFILFIRVFNDKKELSKTHELLKNSQKNAALNSRLASLGVLAAGVGHEINNPLSILTMNSELLKKRVDELGIKDKEVAKRFFIMENTIERVAKIVKGLLTTVRGDAEEIAPLDINEVVRKTVSMVAEIYAKEKIAVVLKLDAKNSFILGNRMKFQQVVMNFISNAKDAIEARGEGGKIVVSTRNYKEKHLIFKVKDNGEGIPEENKEKIFDMFFTTKGVGKGTGMGLSISSGIVEEMRGKIRFETEVGKGTQFEMTFPVCRDLGDSGKPEVEKEEPGPKKLEGRVLVVEDEEILLDMLAKSLSSLGLAVSAASNGEEALKLLKDSSFDILITDLNMPKMDGEELINEVKKDPLHAELKIILASGRVLATEEKLLSRADAVLSKPYSEDGIFKTLSLFLSVKESKRKTA